MKLRIRGSSLRLRLSRGEVAELGRGNAVEDEIAFGAPSGARLVYALRVVAEIDAPVARFDGGRIEVALPAALAAKWTSTEQVGIEAEQPLGDGRALRILVEKDFACLAPRPFEDDSDAYPNPEQGAAKRGG